MAPCGVCSAAHYSLSVVGTGHGRRPPGRCRGRPPAGDRAPAARSRPVLAGPGDRPGAAPRGLRRAAAASPGPAPSSSVDGRAAAAVGPDTGSRAWATTIDPAALARMRGKAGTARRLPGPLALVDARRRDGTSDGIVHLSYSDGIATVSVFEQRGRLDADGLAGHHREVVDGHEVWVTRRGAAAGGLVVRAGRSTPSWPTPRSVRWTRWSRPCRTDRPPTATPSAVSAGGWTGSPPGSTRSGEGSSHRGPHAASTGEQPHGTATRRAAVADRRRDRRRRTATPRRGGPARRATSGTPGRPSPPSRRAPTGRPTGRRRTLADDEHRRALRRPSVRRPGRPTDTLGAAGRRARPQRPEPAPACWSRWPLAHRPASPASPAAALGYLLADRDTASVTVDGAEPRRRAGPQRRSARTAASPASPPRCCRASCRSRSTPRRARPPAPGSSSTRTASLVTNNHVVADAQGAVERHLQRRHDARPREVARAPPRATTWRCSG